MIKAFQSLAKAAFSQKLYDFPSETYMVFHYYFIVTTLIVIPLVIVIQRWAFDFLSPYPKEIHLLIV